jgi:hypothetical protein
MIEFQYFNGCPNSDETLKNLLSLEEDKIIKKKEVKLIEVPDMEKAKEVNFQGSPTILIDGIDIYTGKIPDSCNYSCRVYDVEGQNSGVLSKEYIRNRLESLRK